MVERPKIPPHDVAERMRPYLGNVLEPATRQDQLLEYIGWEILTGGSWGSYGVTFDGWVRFFVDTLEEYSINPKGKGGQSMLAEFVENAQIENYGDAIELADCHLCGESYHQDMTLQFAKRVIYGVDVCENCFKRENYQEPSGPLQQLAEEEQNEAEWLAGPPDENDDDVDEEELPDVAEQAKTGRDPNQPSISAEEANEYLRKLLFGEDEH